MFYRVVLIFPDTEKLAGFITHAEVPGEITTSDYSYVGDLTEEQISIARLYFGAYVRVARRIE